MFRHFWWNKCFLTKEYRNSDTFFLFKAGLFLPKKDGCLCLYRISAVFEPPSFHAISQVPVNTRVFSSMFLEMVIYSFYEILLLRWYQWWYRDCAPVPGCHVCQAEKASFPATSSCFPKATFHTCSSCTSKLQCWHLGNKQGVNASKFYLLEFLAYWLKFIGFLNKSILCKIFWSILNRSDENRVSLNAAETE